MDSNTASIHLENYEKVFMNFHGISSKYVIEIMSSEEYNEMNYNMDEAFGLKFLKCEGHEYIFSVQNKEKYLMAKILYGI